VKERGAVQPIEPAPAADLGGGAFDAVYAAEHVAMVRLAFLLVRSQPVAEELTQEAFLRLWANFGSVESPSGFLRTVVVRLASTWRTRHHMERDHLERLDVEVAESPSEPDETWTAIGRLRPERTEVLVLRFYADLDHREIAEIVGCSPATARSRLRRALADLRKEITR
jgi:RNA polymerase sigma factor (sigma-70 family)